MKPIATKSENWAKNYLMFHKPQHGIPLQAMFKLYLFNLGPCVLKHLWCEIVDSNINYFL